jgi:hypothetical protein
MPALVADVHIARSLESLAMTQEHAKSRERDGWSRRAVGQDDKACRFRGLGRNILHTGPTI